MEGKGGRCQRQRKVWRRRIADYRPGSWGFWLVGVGSLVWLLVRTGRRPDRIRYPCQKVAAANSAVFLGWLVSVLTGHWLYRRLRGYLSWRRVVVVAGLGVLVAAGWRFYRIEEVRRARAQSMGTPQGYRPGRVVWVHDSRATTGNYSNYWQQVDQATVDRMMATALKALTGEQTVGRSLSRIFPCGSSCRGRKVAVKVNFNNVTRSQSVMDANPQTVIALVRQLVQSESGVWSGFRQEDIYIYDVSRPADHENRAYFPQMVKAEFPNVHIVGENCTGGSCDYGTERATFSSEEFEFDSNYCTPQYSHRVAQFLKEVDYLIDMPLLKGYGGGIGATLSFKNHFGSTPNPIGLHPCLVSEGNDEGLVAVYTARFHNSGGSWTSLAEKTVLIVGDGLYGNRSSNVSAPHDWRIFGNDSPNSLFVSQDVVAVDSVMYDVIVREACGDSAGCLTNFERGQRHLEAAAQRQPSLGVHEHWQLRPGCSNGDDLECWDYQVIDFVRCNWQGEMDGVCEGGEPPASPTPTEVVYARGDVDHSGAVDAADVRLILTNWGRLASEVGGYWDPVGDEGVNGMDFGWVVWDW